MRSRAPNASRAKGASRQRCSPPASNAASASRRAGVRARGARRQVRGVPAKRRRARRGQARVPRVLPGRRVAAPRGPRRGDARPARRHARVRGGRADGLPQLWRCYVQRTPPAVQRRKIDRNWSSSHRGCRPQVLALGGYSADGPQRRRGRDVEIPRRRVATSAGTFGPRPPAGTRTQNLATASRDPKSSRTRATAWS